MPQSKNGTEEQHNSSFIKSSRLHYFFNSHRYEFDVVKNSILVNLVKPIAIVNKKIKFVPRYLLYVYGLLFWPWQNNVCRSAEKFLAL